MRNGVVWAVVALGVLGSASVWSQGYPAKPVRIVTGTAGNFNDIVARHIAQSLSERWKQPVIVENRPGAGLTIGTALVVQSAPDGYTLVLSDRTALAAAPSLYRKLSYDPLRDLTPITLVASAPMLLLAHPSVPAGNLTEFIAYLRGVTQPFDFASAGNATVTHLAAEVLRQVTGANLVSVHYKSSPPAMLGLLAGETKAAFMIMSVALPHLKAGKVKAYAITSRTRFEGTPEVPTVGEAGLPELEAEYWLALLAPAATPDAIIDKINRDTVELLSSPDMKQAMLGLGARAIGSTPQYLAFFMRDEAARLRKVIEVAGIKSD